MIEATDVPVTFKNMEMERYIVTCGVTGKHIPLNDVKYWNCEQQIAYIGPDVIPKDHFYLDIVPQALEITSGQT